MDKKISVTIPTGCPELFKTSLRIVIEEVMKRYAVSGVVTLEEENTLFLHEAPVYAESAGSAERGAEALHIPLEGEAVHQSQR